MRLRLVASQIGRDIAHGVRAFGRTPGFSAVVILSIGVGIGANTAVFSWLQARLLNPIPAVKKSARFHQIEPRGETGMYPGSSWQEFRDLRQRLTAFEDVVAFRMVPLSVSAGDQAGRATGTLVSHNYFDALGLDAARGRLPHEGDEQRDGGREPVVVLSHDYWTARLAASEQVIGSHLRINDRVLTVVAVAPEAFQGTVMGLSVDLWIPATLAPVVFDGTRELENRGQRGYSLAAALRSGTSLARAQADVDQAMRELAAAYPETNATFVADVLPFWQSPRGPQRFLTTALAMLQGAMLLVLAAVCGNTANLVLARASARQSETAIRLALGAGRWRIVSLVLAEHLVLAMAGAGVGALLAMWGTEALRAVPMPTPGGMTLKFQTGVDGLALLFAVGLGVICGLAFGLAPALQLARTPSTSALRAGASPAGRSRVRDVLMLTEVALALVVLVVAALFLRSFNETQRADPGFRREGVLLAAYDLRGRLRNVDATTATDFASRLTERLGRLPGVEAVAIATAVPLDIHGMGSRSFVLEGAARADGALDQALTNTVTAGYFATMRIPLVAGRDFVALTDATAPPEVIVNEAFADRYAPAGVLGRILESAGRRFVVVGVAANSLYNAFGEAPTPFIYLSWRDRPAPVGEVHIRTREGAETAVVTDVRRAVRDINPTLPIYNVRTLTDHVDANLVFRRIPARMFVVLGPLLLALAVGGIYAVVAYAVSRRRTEIGMRLALGGSPGRVIRDLVVETLRVVALGIVAGLAVAYLLTDASTDGQQRVGVFASAAGLLLLMSAMASWIPARRAARVDPSAALRE